MGKHTRRQRIRKALILISFLLFPVTLNYFSPYVIIDGASHGIIAGSFLVFTSMFITALVIGRAFCGWLCPAGGLQEYCFAVKDKKVWGGKYNWIKYFIWLPWISFIAFAFRAGGFSKIDPFYLTESGISVTDPGNYIPYLIVVFGFVIGSLAIGKRAACHYICWMAPFMIIGRKIRNKFKWPSLHIEVDRAKCTRCKKCDEECPMSLAVSEMVQKGSMENTECILCGTCVDVCPNNVKKLTF